MESSEAASTKMLYKKELLYLKKIAIFTGKHLCWSLFLIKLQALFYKIIYLAEHLRIVACESRF